MKGIEKKTIEGKEWLSFDSELQKFKYEQGNKIQVIGFILIVVMLLFVVLYKEAFMSNPLVFGVRSLKLEGCSCYGINQGVPYTLIVNSSGMFTLEDFKMDMTNFSN